MISSPHSEVIFLWDENIKEPRGRPLTGAEPKTAMIKLRLEPYLDEQLTWICRQLGITKSQAIRQGIRLLIREYTKHHDY